MSLHVLLRVSRVERSRVYSWIRPTRADHGPLVSIMFRQLRTRRRRQQSPSPVSIHNKLRVDLLHYLAGLRSPEFFSPMLFLPRPRNCCPKRMLTVHLPVHALCNTGPRYLGSGGTRIPSTIYRRQLIS